MPTQNVRSFIFIHYVEKSALYHKAERRFSPTRQQEQLSAAATSQNTNPPFFLIFKFHALSFTYKRISVATSESCDRAHVMKWRRSKQPPSFISRWKLTTEKVNDIKSPRVEDIRDKVHSEPNAMKRAIIIQRLFKQTLNKQALIPNRKRLLCAVSLVTVIASANIGLNPDETTDYPPTRYSTLDPVLEINNPTLRIFPPGFKTPERIRIFLNGVGPSCSERLPFKRHR